MACLYCGGSLGLLSRGQFCSKKHQELYREQEAQLSIQRLKEAFTVEQAGDKPAFAKARPTSVSVLDGPPRDAEPPAEFFAYDAPPAQPAESLATPISTPVEQPGVFYCGPASEPDAPSDAPPDAGFIFVA